MDDYDDDDYFDRNFGIIFFSCMFIVFVALTALAIMLPSVQTETHFFPRCDNKAPIHLDIVERDYREALTVGQTATLQGWSNVVVHGRTVSGDCQYGHV